MPLDGPADVLVVPPMWSGGYADPVHVLRIITVRGLSVGTELVVCSPPPNPSLPSQFVDNSPPRPHPIHHVIVPFPHYMFIRTTYRRGVVDLFH